MPHAPSATSPQNPRTHPAPHHLPFESRPPLFSDYHLHHHSSPPTTYITDIDSSNSESQVDQRCRRHPIRSGRDGGRDHRSCDAHDACVCLTNPKIGGSQALHLAMRYTTCDEHHYQPSGYRLSPGWLSVVYPAVGIVSATLTVATPLCLWCVQPLIWAYFSMLVFAFGIFGNVRTVNPAPSPGNNPRQLVPLGINAAATMLLFESTMITFLPGATAVTTMTTSTATA